MVMLTKMLGHSLYNVDLVSSSSDVIKQRKKFKNPKLRGIHFHEGLVSLKVLGDYFYNLFKFITFLYFII